LPFCHLPLDVSLPISTFAVAVPSLVEKTTETIVSVLPDKTIVISVLLWDRCAVYADWANMTVPLCVHGASIPKQHAYYYRFVGRSEEHTSELQSHLKL